MTTNQPKTDVATTDILERYYNCLVPFKLIIEECKPIEYVYLLKRQLAWQMNELPKFDIYLGRHFRDPVELSIEYIYPMLPSFSAKQKELCKTKTMGLNKPTKPTLLELDKKTILAIVGEGFLIHADSQICEKWSTKYYKDITKPKIKLEIKYRGKNESNY